MATKPYPDRERLGKKDADLIAQALQKRGLAVHQSGGRVEGFDKETNRYICGYYWQNLPGEVGCWRFDIPLADIYSRKDLRTSLREVGRIRPHIKAARVAWKEFRKSKSSKRWQTYRGIVASLFMRQDWLDD